MNEQKLLYFDFFRYFSENFGLVYDNLPFDLARRTNPDCVAGDAAFDAAIHDKHMGSENIPLNARALANVDRVGLNLFGYRWLGFYRSYATSRRNATENAPFRVRQIAVTQCCLIEKGGLDSKPEIAVKGLSTQLSVPYFQYQKVRVAIYPLLIHRLSRRFIRPDHAGFKIFRTAVNDTRSHRSPCLTCIPSAGAAESRAAVARCGPAPYFKWRWGHGRRPTGGKQCHADERTRFGHELSCL